MNDGIRYVALGDSLTLGTGALLSPGFVQRFAQLTERKFHSPLYVDVFAKNRIPSHELVEMVTSNHVVRNSISRANMITITIGGNDLLQANRLFQTSGDVQHFEVALDHLYNNLKTITFEIHRLKAMSATPYFIRIIGLYNPYPYLQHSEYWVDRFNGVLSSFSDSIHSQFVDISPLFKYNQRLISFDGLHPNSRGYQYIAEKLAGVGYYPLD